MKPIGLSSIRTYIMPLCRPLLLTVTAMLLMPFNLFSNSLSVINTDEPLTASDDDEEIVQEEFTDLGQRLKFQPLDTIAVEGPLTVETVDSIGLHSDDEWVRRDIEFNPSPTRAVWMAALFPGLGQLYNRRYWKLPLVVGGYLGLAYATNWNNGMLNDYTKAYADIMDNDPTTKSYMDLFPSTVKEENLDKNWLQKVLQSRKNYFRRNRDLCIIAMIGVYLVAVVDAYVDAALSHFDISPDLSMDLYPTIMRDGRNRMPSFGLQWAFNF